jgi:dTMP kinase
MKRLRNFIAVEGAHGTGKTTISRLLVTNLQRMGRRAVYTKEPYVRSLLQLMSQLSTKRSRGPLALAQLVAADRFLHLRQIRAWLSNGSTVVTDRYLASSFVYQIIDGLSPELVSQLNNFVEEPWLKIYVIAPYAIRFRRLKEKIRSRPSNFFLTRQSLRKEQRLYDALIGREKGQSRSLILDGTLTAKQLTDQATEFVLHSSNS